MSAVGPKAGDGRDTGSCRCWVTAPICPDYMPSWLKLMGFGLQPPEDHGVSHPSLRRTGMQLYVLHSPLS